LSFYDKNCCVYRLTNIRTTTKYFHLLFASSLFFFPPCFLQPSQNSLSLSIYLSHSHLHSCTSDTNRITESRNSSGRKINLGCWNICVFLVVDTFRRCKTKKCVVHVHIIKACGWVEIWNHSFLTLMMVSFTPWTTIGTKEWVLSAYCVGNRIGSRPGLDALDKIKVSCRWHVSV
jgi:hypothetical protein